MGVDEMGNVPDRVPVSAKTVEEALQQIIDHSHHEQEIGLGLWFSLVLVLHVRKVLDAEDLDLLVSTLNTHLKGAEMPQAQKDGALKFARASVAAAALIVDEIKRRVEGEN